MQPNPYTTERQADADAAGLEDKNVTRPAPIDQPPQGQEQQQEGLEDLNVTRPNPPAVERAGSKSAL